MTSVCFGDTYTSHQKPNADSTLDIGTSVLLWRYIYGDAFTDGTALWSNNNLSGFSTISATILTDGTFRIHNGKVTDGEWNADDIDISSYTNLIAGTNITLLGDTLNVDDAFLVNDADDTTTGTLTAAGFTTAGAVTAGGAVTGAGSTFGDGGTTDYIAFDDLGVLTLHGDARVVRQIILGAAKSAQAGSNIPAIYHLGNYSGRKYEVNDYSYFDFEVPYDCDVSEVIDIELHWYIEKANPGGGDDELVSWRASYTATKEDDTEAVDAATANLDSLDVSISGTSKHLLQTKLGSGMTIEQEDVIGVKLTRIASSNDPTGQDPVVLSMEVEYTMNNLGDSLLDIYNLLLETGDDLLLEIGGSIILENI